MKDQLLDQLRALFPGDHPVDPDPLIAQALRPGETVVWQGRCAPEFDRKGNRLYAITDQRLLCFYKQEIRHDVTPDDIQYLKTHKVQVSGFKANPWAPSVVWHDVPRADGTERTYYGFIGIDDPKSMRDKLRTWRDLLYEEQERRDTAFAADESADILEVANPRFGFALTVPGHWRGRVAVHTPRQPKFLGFKLPFKMLDSSDEAQLPEITTNWNFLELVGLGGVSITLDVKEGPLETTFDEQLREAGVQPGDKLLLELKEDIQQAPFRGFSMIIDFTEKKGFKWFNGAVQRLWLGTADFHLQMWARALEPANASQTDVLDRVIASIRALET